MARQTKWDDKLPEKARELARNASKDEISAALIHATEFIDMLPFKGERLTERQSLSWPRKGVFRDDGAPVVGVPEEIKEATCLVASFILAKIPFDGPAVAWVMFKIGHLLKEDTNLIDRHITWH